MRWDEEGLETVRERRGGGARGGAPGGGGEGKGEEGEEDEQGESTLCGGEAADELEGGVWRGAGCAGAGGADGSRGGGRREKGVPDSDD